MFCGNCGAQMNDKQQFCSKCGTKVEETKVEIPKQFCGSCGKELEEDEVFCGNCGAKKEEQVNNAKAEVKKEAEPEKPVKAKKKNKIILILLILIIAIVGAGYYYMYTINSPDEIVKRFCKTMEEEEYEKMFSTMSFPESEYITKELFDEYMESGSYEKISKVEYKFLEDESDDEKRVYEAKATIDGDEETDEITLVKSDSKKYFLFDDWGIEMDSMLVDEWEISVPKGSALSINGTEVKSDKTEEEGNDVYVVKDLLRVSYEVKVTHPLAEEYNEKLAPYISANVELDAKSDLQGELKGYFGNFVKEFYVSILQNSNATSSSNRSNVGTLTSNNNIYDYISETYGENVEELYESGMNDAEIQKYFNEKYNNIYSELSKVYNASPSEETNKNNAASSNSVTEPVSPQGVTGIRKYVRDDQAYTDVTNQGKIIRENIVDSLSYYYQNVDIKNVAVTNFNTNEISITGGDSVTLETSCTLSFDYLFKDSYSNSTYRRYSGTKELELTVVKVDNTWLIINIK